VGEGESKIRRYSDENKVLHDCERRTESDTKD